MASADGVLKLGDKRAAELCRGLERQLSLPACSVSHSCRIVRGAGRTEATSAAADVYPLSLNDVELFSNTSTINWCAVRGKSVLPPLREADTGEDRHAASPPANNRR